MAIETEFPTVRLQELRACYVEPHVQDFNPPDELNDPGLNVSRERVFEHFDRFLHRPNLAENGNRCLFVLGDAGMGKTSLLVMLKQRQLDGHFPTDRPCVLMKLGPETTRRIEAIPEPASTVLLIDSLDEDPVAVESERGAEDRLAELLPVLARFHRAVITCRTQFFVETSAHLTTKKGHFVVGSYECPVKYLSLFDDEQVEAYLLRHYRPDRVKRFLRALRLWRGEDARLARARLAARAMDSLRLRPLLLSHIDDFVDLDGNSSVDFGNRYAVYHRLVNAWLIRDAQKPPVSLSCEESWRVAALLAVYFAREKGRERIPREELAKVPGLENVPKFRIEARSLLSRTSQHDYQFAHRTIPEFLVAHAVLDTDMGLDVADLDLSREAYAFVQEGERLRASQGQIVAPSLGLRGARLRFAGSAVEFVRKEFGIELVAIAPGEFSMGSPDSELGRSSDEVPHSVRLTREFWIGKFAVTQAEYQAVMGENPSHFKGDRRPVEYVDWEQASTFCRKLTSLAREAGVAGEGWEFRLPTEAEWEYACRAGTTSAFNDGSACSVPQGKDPALLRLGWHGEGGKGKTHPVGEKAPNAWGLHDMHGNVWEWCADQAAVQNSAVVTDTYVDGIVDPFCTKGARRVVRGGAFWGSAGGCRSADRIAGGPGDRIRFLGFRLVAGQPVRSGAPGLEARGAAAPVPEARAGREGAERRKRGGVGLE